MTVPHIPTRNVLQVLSAACVLLTTTVARGQIEFARGELDAPPSQALSLDTLAQWASFIAPSADELRWKEIPWRESFWKAIHEGQIHGKPVLLWAMNGHPLGCT